MSLININNLTFAYENGLENIFENISFSIDSDWKLGLIGRNGKGKTTLLKLLMNELEYKGSIFSQLKFKYFPIQIKNQNDLIINIINDTFPEILDWEIIKEIGILNGDVEILYRPLNTLSNGEQIKVLLAALFLCKDCFFLLDEPTSHLDLQTKNAIKEYLKQKKGFIIVSHDREILNECIDHVLVIENNKIEVQKGNFASYSENKKRQDHYEIMQNDTLNKEIKKLQKATKQNTVWAEKSEKKKNEIGASGLRPDKGYVSHKAAKIMKRAKTFEKKALNAVAEKKDLLKNVETIESLKIQGNDYFKNTLIEVKDLEIYYEGKTIFKPLTFKVNKNEKIAIVGKNGAGKSSLLKLLTQHCIHYNGTINIGSQLTISYIFQDTNDLAGTLNEFISKYNIDEHQFKAILIKLGLNNKEFTNELNNYSEGQKKKVLIAKSLCEKAHLYIWDEPLNYIDVFSRLQLEELLTQANITLLFVEHDQTFVNKVATKIIYL